MQLKKMVREREVTIKILVREDGTYRFPGKEKILAGTKNNSKGYMTCRLTQYVHRLVAKAFVKNPRPDIFNMVDHIDGNPSNNHYTNLRWVDCQLNNSHRANCNNTFFWEVRRKQWRGAYKVGGKKKQNGSTPRLKLPSGHSVRRRRRGRICTKKKSEKVRLQLKKL